MNRGESGEAGTVLSVNVGEPRPVSWGGRDVRTSIWKTPVDGPVRASGTNLAGDQQSDRRVHGGPDKAVYVYTAEDYRWWESHLGATLPPGTFGENLTVAGINLADAVVGEKWAVGGARLVVTQPRLPCFKLGIRMGDAAFVDRFQAVGRYGVYLGIEGEGDIEAGDPVARVSRPAHGLTAYEIAEIYFAHTPEGLQRVAEGAGVPEEWRNWARRGMERGAGSG
jgi:MOSC domain-containing protein YiiM